MKYNKSLIILMIFAVIAGISMIGSVSAADTNTTINATNTTANTAVETNATGQSKYKGPQTNTTKWTNSSIVTNKVTVTKNGTIYLVNTFVSPNAGGILYAFNPDGTLMWSFDTGFTGATVKGSPVIGNDGTIYFVVEGNLYAMNTNGTSKWVYHTGTTGSTSTPIIDSNGIIYFTSSYNVYAIDTKSDPNGNGPKWEYSLPSGDSINSGAALSADGKTLYFGTHTNGLLYALNTLDGTQKWNYTTGEIDGAPVVGPDGTIYVGTYTGVLYAITDSGNQATVKWNPTIKTFNGPSIALSKEGIIYIGCYKASDNFYAVNSSDGSVKYYCSLTGAIAQTAVIGSDGTVYIGTIKGVLYALNPDLTVKWSYNSSGRFYCPTMGSDGTLYIGGYSLFAFQDLVANFTPAQGNNPLNYTFKDTSSNIPTQWSWEFGDGTTSTEQNPTHKYTTPGKYTVKLTVTTTYGDTNITTQEITVVTDTTSPVVTTKPSGTYNNPITLTAGDDFDQNPTLYYSLDNGATWHTATQSTTLTLADGTYTIQYYAEDATGNKGTTQTATYTIDTKAPTAAANVKAGTYNTNKAVTLTISENGTIYYTLNGATPTTASTRYTGPITISSTKTLKYIAVDAAGNSSPVYSATYTIDKVAPKISSVYPKNKAKSVSRTSTITIKFTENIKATTNWSKIYVKNLKTGKLIKISKLIKNNTLYLKTSKKSANTTYKINIPAAALKDNVGNKLAKGYTWTFKTGKK